MSTNKNFVLRLIENSDDILSYYDKLILWPVITFVTFFPTKFSEIEFCYRIAFFLLLLSVYILLSIFKYEKIKMKIFCLLSYFAWKKINKNLELKNILLYEVPPKKDAILKFLEDYLPNWSDPLIAMCIMQRVEGNGWGTRKD